MPFIPTNVYTYIHQKKHGPHKHHQLEYGKQKSVLIMQNLRPTHSGGAPEQMDVRRWPGREGVTNDMC